MAVLSKGSFSLNLGIVQLGAELSDQDRQCAWELYTEISTRVAVVGKVADDSCEDFSGEIYSESLTSVFHFFQESRKIMRTFPVGQLGQNQQDHLGVMISRMLEDVLRPFLEKWQSQYRHWWESEGNPRLAPMLRQEEFPHLAEFLADWSAVRWLMREVKKELIRVYALR